MVKRCEHYGTWYSSVCYLLQSKKLQADMLQTSPPSSVHDVAFPHDYSEVFAACGLGEIRIWHLHSRRELLRMSVPNLDCRCVAFMQVCAPPDIAWDAQQAAALAMQEA